MSRTASILVPSQLPKGTDPLIQKFVSSMQNDVFRDFLAGLDTLEECLQRGAVLRLRLLSDMQQMTPRRQKHIQQWLKPPSSESIEQLEIRAVAVLGSERALHISGIFRHSFSNLHKIQQRLDGKLDEHQAVKLVVLATRLMGCAAENDVLSVLWMMLLYGDLALPAPEVLDRLYARFIEVASDYLTQTGALLREASLRTPGPMLEDRSQGWFDRHPAIRMAAAWTLGLLHEDPAVARVQLVAHADPEIEGAESLELHAFVTGEPDAAEERLTRQMLQAGLLGVQSDSTGAAWFLRVSAAG